MSAIDDAKELYDTKKLDLQQALGYASSDLSILSRKVAEIAAIKTYALTNKALLDVVVSLKNEIVTELGTIDAMVTSMKAQLDIINNP